jgi:hypothetical protein
MMHMGGDLPAFLERMGGSDPALPDLARLELALRQSYHAADAAPAPPEALQAVPPEALASLRLGLAPALRLVPSAHPIVSLRRAALEGGKRPADAPEAALVTRPGFDPEVAALAPAEAAFVSALADGLALGAAVDAAAVIDAAFTPATVLAHLLQGGAIVSIDQESDA